MTTQEIIIHLSSLTPRLGFDLSKVEQGSTEWLISKLGVLSASNVEKILAGKTTQGRQTYMAELVAQVCTGEMPELDAKQLRWGRDHEAAARSAYEFATGETIEQVPFIFKDDSMRVGCSPDGLIKGKNKGLELKCPFSTKVYIEFLTCDKIKPEYVKQCQFSMWITGASEWDFANYDPRMNKNMIKIVTLKRDEEMMKEFDVAVPAFIDDMDKMLKKAGFSFGDQWQQIKKAA